MKTIVKSTTNISKDVTKSMHMRIHGIIYKETHLLDDIKYIECCKSEVMRHRYKVGSLKGDEKED